MTTHRWQDIKRKFGVESYDLARRGLEESLETYAARIKRTPDEARYLWRVGALEALHVPRDYSHGVVSVGLCRIAPGVSVPTRAVEWSDP
jgi:hypothetical protein